jgi:hypothetical protein
MLCDRANRDLAPSWRNALPSCSVCASHRNPRHDLAPTGASQIRSDVNVRKCCDPSLDVLSQCGWTASSGGNRLRSRSHLMSHAALVNNFIEHGEVATVPHLAEESLYYVSGIHVRAVDGMWQTR